MFFHWQAIILKIIHTFVKYRLSVYARFFEFFERCGYNGGHNRPVRELNRVIKWNAAKYCYNKGKHGLLRDKLIAGLYNHRLAF